MLNRLSIFSDRCVVTRVPLYSGGLGGSAMQMLFTNCFFNRVSVWSSIDLDGTRNSGVKVGKRGRSRNTWLEQEYGDEPGTSRRRRFA